jgi:NTE family protein
MDDSWGIIRDAERLVESYGWHKGDFFRNRISLAIKAKTGNSELTFADI